MNQIEAETAFKQAMAWQQQGQLDEAQRLYEQILAVHRNHHHALHLLGVVVSMKGRHAYARRLIETSLSLQPDDPDALANLGQVYFSLGLFEKAWRCCQQSIDLQPANARCQLNCGKSLRQLGRFSDAIAYFDEALRLQPTLSDAFANRGFCLHNLGRFDEALDDYNAVLQGRPDSAEVLNNRGHALFAVQRYEEAVADVERALQLSPNFPDALYHRGLMLQHEKKWEEALAFYTRAVQLRPHYVQVLERQAYVMHQLKKSPQDCIATLDTALSADPHHVSVLTARAGFLVGIRLLSEALQDYDRAIELAPNDAKIHADRGETLLKLNRPEEAILALQKALALGGDQEQLRYTLASLGQAETPESAPVAYVVSLFDWYADRFDDHLQGTLKYDTPKLLCQRVSELVPSGLLDVLDLGCGTGLCGPFLKPVARTLTGVDLSSNMLEMARKRGLYDDLVCSDLTQFLAPQQAAYDLVIATDVFIYVGALEAVFKATQKALRPAGLFAFSFEVAEGPDLVLRASRRYAHSVNYVQRLASQHGFAVLSLEPSVIREDAGGALNGYLAILRAAS